MTVGDPDLSPTWASWGNTPHPDGLVMRWCWRRPARPFKRPTCCEGAPVVRLWRNLYRCTRCATRIEPERLRHRLMLWWNPFRGGDNDHPFRDLVKVFKWAKP